MEFQTTFWTDFCIADVFGIDAVKDTFNRSFRDWKDNYVYLTELVIVMNLKCWWHYEISGSSETDEEREKHTELSRLYSEYYYQAREYALDNLKGAEFQYFWRMTD